MDKAIAVISFLVHSVVVGAQDSTRLSLIFVGDIMQHDSQIRAALNVESRQYSYAECFEYIRPILQNADLTIGNLELTLAGPPFKGYPQFSAPDALAFELQRAGFDVLVTANNHSLDRRKKGLERTIDILDSLEIMHTGTFKDSVERIKRYPLLIEKKGIRISLLNYTFGTNGIPTTPPNIVNLLDTATISNDITAAKLQDPDIIAAFVHWGAEYQSQPNRDQKRLAQFFFDHGVRLVIGSHPHVLQPMVWNKEDQNLVAYSLGNFVSGQQSRYRDGGAILKIELEKVSHDSTSMTSVSHAEYDLAWVYRNNEVPKKYFILPVKEFETDTVLLDNDASIRLKEFASDSRALLGGQELKETWRSLLDINYFDIHLGDSLLAAPDSSSVLNFYGLNNESDSDSTVHFTTNRFYDREVAEQALMQIHKNTEYKNAFLVWHYWNRKKRLLAAE